MFGGFEVIADPGIVNKFSGSELVQSKCKHRP